jgi:hypothetical protein
MNKIISYHIVPPREEVGFDGYMKSSASRVVCRWEERRQNERQNEQLNEQKKNVKRTSERTTEQTNGRTNNRYTAFGEERQNGRTAEWKNGRTAEGRTAERQEGRTAVRLIYIEFTDIFEYAEWQSDSAAER